MIVQNKECGNLGDSAGFSLEMVLRSAPSPLRVEGSRPVTKEVVREQRLTFLPVVVHRNKPLSLCGPVQGQNVEQLAAVLSKLNEGGKHMERNSPCYAS